MFRPPSPDKPSAGFKLGDYIPKRCFNLFQGPDFTDTRSPDPSPMTSPVRGGAALPDDDVSPIRRLAGFFVGGFASPQRPTTPTPAPTNRRPHAKPNVAPATDLGPPPPRRKYNRHGPKHGSFKKEAHRRPRVVPPQRRGPQVKYKRDGARMRMANAHERRMAQASEDLSGLRTTAETIMNPVHMTREDFIFLKQLRKLEVDQKVEHDLQRYRDQMMRAAEETEERREEHEAMDAEAEKLWGDGQDDEARAEQQRKVDAFVRANDNGEGERRRLAEEKAMRADEARQRDHQEAERRIRERQERLFREELARKAREEERRKQEEEERQRKEMERRQRIREQEERDYQRREKLRKLWEEIGRARQAQRERMRRTEEECRQREEDARLRREAQEREERERQAREEQERQARLRAEEEQIRYHFLLYEGKWNELRTNNTLPPIHVEEMPWPVFGVVSSADQITHQGVRAFLFHPLRPGMEGKTTRDKVKPEVLRFHPDKFDTRVVPRIVPCQQAVAQEIAGAIARVLTTIMTEDVEQQ